MYKQGGTIHMIMDFFESNQAYLLDNVRSAIFVGICPGSEEFDVIQKFCERGCQCLCIEVYRENCVHSIPDLGCVPIICTDMRNMKDLFVPQSVDMIWAKQVLEHVPHDDAMGLLREWKEIARQIVLVETPYGECPQGSEYDNPHDEHLCSVTPKMLFACGYDTWDVQEDINPDPKDIRRHNLLGLWERPKI